MTTPSGTISMSQVNTELGLSATATVSLNQSNVRSLAGVASGAISMNDLRGKSATVALSAYIDPGYADGYNTGTTVTTSSVTVYPTGGNGTYSYVWTTTTDSGSHITCSNSTGKTVTFSALEPIGQSSSGTAECTVTSGGQSCSAGIISVTIQRQ